MKFGVEIPTCTSGMMHPVPFATVEQVVDTAIEAEQLGYYDAGGNDHLSTMRFVREAWSAPPDYFEPLMTLAHVAARTSVLRLTTGIMVAPMREPVLLAKQVATLDQLSGGRVILGVAVGGYRDEFEAVRPDLAGANRAELTRETLTAVRAIWEQPRATYQGKYVRFTDVESYPKPVQAPLPVYSGGNVDGSLRRAAELCQGWLPAKIGPSKIAEGRTKLAGYARAVGRDPSTITTALQSVVPGRHRRAGPRHVRQLVVRPLPHIVGHDHDQGHRSGRLPRHQSGRYPGPGVCEGRRPRRRRVRAPDRVAVRGQHRRGDARADPGVRPARRVGLP